MNQPFISPMPPMSEKSKQYKFGRINKSFNFFYLICLIFCNLINRLPQIAHYIVILCFSFLTYATFMVICTIFIESANKPSFGELYGFVLLWVAVVCEFGSSALPHCLSFEPGPIQLKFIMQGSFKIRANIREWTGFKLKQWDVLGEMNSIFDSTA